MVRLCLSISLQLALLIPHLLISGVVSSATFTLLNNCSDTVWPGILTTSAGGIDPGQNTGYTLQKGESKTIIVPSSWQGRFWGRTHCAEDSSGNFTCLTGDCGSGKPACSKTGSLPATSFAEFTISGSGGLDFFDISLVDGFNLPIIVVPQGGTGRKCSSTGCTKDLNDVCPPELKVMSSYGTQVACKSACAAFGDAQYCCNGQYSSPDTCKPSSYSKVFKSACPTAYSYAYDDVNSTFTCTGANYLIAFCPTLNDTRNSGGVCRNGTESGADPTCLDKPGNNTKAPGPRNNTKAPGPGNNTKASGPENNTKASGPGNNTKASGPQNNTKALGLKIGIAKDDTHQEVIRHTYLLKNF